jgi:hypothetical protein
MTMVYIIQTSIIAGEYKRDIFVAVGWVALTELIWEQEHCRPTGSLRAVGGVRANGA